MLQVADVQDVAVIKLSIRKLLPEFLCAMLAAIALWILTGPFIMTMWALVLLAMR